MPFPTPLRAARLTLAAAAVGAALAATATAQPADVHTAGVSRAPAAPPMSRSYLHYVSGHAPRDLAPTQGTAASTPQSAPVDTALWLAVLGLLAVAGVATVSLAHVRGSGPGHARRRRGTPV